jgi:hypothetical protein
MTDIDAIKARVQALQRHAGGTDYAAQVIADSLVLLAEVERLRERDDNFCDDFHRVTSEACAPDELHCSCVPHLRAQVSELQTLGASLHKAADVGAQAERAAVVAFLREQGRVAGASPDEKRMLAYASSHIERGEHRREEGA